MDVKFIYNDFESFLPLTYPRRGVQRPATTNAVAHETTFLVGLRLGDAACQYPNANVG